MNISLSFLGILVFHLGAAHCIFASSPQQFDDQFKTKFQALKQVHERLNPQQDQRPAKQRIKDMIDEQTQLLNAAQLETLRTQGDPDDHAITLKTYALWTGIISLDLTQHHWRDCPNFIVQSLVLKNLKLAVDLRLSNALPEELMSMIETRLASIGSAFELDKDPSFPGFFDAPK